MLEITVDELKQKLGVSKVETKIVTEPETTTPIPTSAIPKATQNIISLPETATPKKNAIKMRAGILVVIVLGVQFLFSTNFAKAWISKFIKNPMMAKITGFGCVIIISIIAWFLLARC